MAYKTTVFIAPILDLSGAPEDPVERVIWLDGVLAKVTGELDRAYGEAYFEARLEGRFEDAVKYGKTSRTKALRYTRNHNDRTGRTIHWSDGLDPTSTVYPRQ
jgi:hypothetical protein